MNITQLISDLNAEWKRKQEGILKQMECCSKGNCGCPEARLCMCCRNPGTTDYCNIDLEEYNREPTPEEFEKHQIDDLSRRLRVLLRAFNLSMFRELVDKKMDEEEEEEDLLEDDC